jgi:hypothetical protein
MPKESQSIQLQGGVSRLKNANINRPYSLENAEMQLNGYLRAVNEPSVNTAETAESKPYVEWNGDILDRASFSQSEGQGQISATVLSDAKLNARLYRSVKSTDAETNDNYRIVKFFSDWSDVSTDENWQGEPALVYSASAALQDFTEYSYVTGSVDATTVEPDIHAGYLAIPFDSNGEAGNWFYFASRS